MFRHIAWFNEAPVELNAEGGLTSPDDTVRRRCLVPARELEKQGVECLVFGNLHDADPTQVGSHLQKLGAEIVIVSASDGTSLFKLARTAKHLGCYVVVDFGSVASVSDDMRKLAQMADQVVVADDDAATKLQAENITALVIPDSKDGAMPAKMAALWAEGLKKLKSKPPACANTNIPTTEHA